MVDNTTVMSALSDITLNSFSHSMWVLFESSPNGTHNNVLSITVFNLGQQAHEVALSGNSIKLDFNNLNKYFVSF